MLIQLRSAYWLDLKTVWDAPTTDARLKKRIVRTLVHEVVAGYRRRGVRDRSHRPLGGWRPQRVALAQAPARTSATAPLPDIIQAVRQLVLIASDDLIAASSTATASRRQRNRWTRERVTSMPLELPHPGVQACRGRDRTLAQPRQRRKAPEDRAQDAAAGR